MATWSGNLPSTFRQAEFDALIESTPGCLDGELPLVGVHFDSEWWDSVTHNPPMRTYCWMRGTPAAVDALLIAMGGAEVTEEFHPGIISLRGCNTGTNRWISFSGIAGACFVEMFEDCEAEGIWAEAGGLKRLKP